MMVLLSGAVAGSMHVVSGPDHLVALTPLAVHGGKRAARVGAIWGFGHGLGVAVVAGLGVAAKGLVDVDALSAWSEFLVGIALVGLGLWAIRKAMLVTIHSHGHAHPEMAGHEHFHVHVGEEHNSDAHRGHSHMALGVGMLHGAAGTGHILGVVPALALPPVDAFIFVGSYLVAAVVSMTLFAGLLSRFISDTGQLGLRRLMISSGVLAIALGLVWASQGWPLTS